MYSICMPVKYRFLRNNWHLGEWGERNTQKKKAHKEASPYGLNPHPLIC